MFFKFRHSEKRPEGNLNIKQQSLPELAPKEIRELIKKYWSIFERAQYNTAYTDEIQSL
jgi:hypothetical protein